MNSSELSSVQVEALLRSARRFRRYLYRMKVRITEARFPLEDSLQHEVLELMGAVDNYGFFLRHLKQTIIDWRENPDRPRGLGTRRESARFVPPKGRHDIF